MVRSMPPKQRALETLQVAMVAGGQLRRDGEGFDERALHCRCCRTHELEKRRGFVFAA